MDTVTDSLNYSELGRSLGCSRQTVWGWFQPGNRVPAERVIGVEKVTGIPRHVLRPDLYPEAVA